MSDQSELPYIGTWLPGPHDADGVWIEEETAMEPNNEPTHWMPIAEFKG